TLCKKMDSISKALVLAVQYIGSDRSDDTHSEDDDLSLAEELASLIQESSEEEQKALMKVADEMGLKEWSAEFGIGPREV
ncbi:hypothetical protein, partial [Roseibacillus persicicus]|uniref:hypothetical protein n=1 Tax=Roseibacillus persicicus TaxID=454148 RepID=UPI00280C8AFA